MKRSTLAAAVAAAALSFASLAAQAALIVKISDGVNADLTVSDNGVGDFTGAAGVVNFNGSYGNWLLTVAVASGSADPLQMHLTSSVTNGSSLIEGTKVAIGAPLTISFTQTDLVSAVGSSNIFNVRGGGSGVANSAASWSIFADASNAAFGQGQTLYSSTGYTTSDASVGGAVAGPYSLTLAATFDYSAVTAQLATSSLDLNLDVPEPSSVALVGLAMIGAVGAGRRRKTQA